MSQRIPCNTSRRSSQNRTSLTRFALIVAAASKLLARPAQKVRWDAGKLAPKRLTAASYLRSKQRAGGGLSGCGARWDLRVSASRWDATANRRAGRRDPSALRRGAGTAPPRSCGVAAQRRRLNRRKKGCAGRVRPGRTRRAGAFLGKRPKTQQRRLPSHSGPLRHRSRRWRRLPGPRGASSPR